MRAQWGQGRQPTHAVLADEEQIVSRRVRAQQQVPLARSQRLERTKRGPTIDAGVVSALPSERRAVEVMTGPEGGGIVLVAGRDERLLGVVVDFDIRKSILKGVSLEAPLSRVMNPKPFTLPFSSTRAEITRSFCF